MQTHEQRGIFLITGIMASGKSTVAELLAKKFEKGVHFRGNVFRRMIVSGREEVLPDTTDEAIRQLRLRYKLAAATADTYFEAGFSVVLQDVMLGSMLQETVDLIQNRPLHVIVLCPSQEAVEKREADRVKKGYGLWSVSELDWQLREETPKIGMWIDTTELSAEKAAEQIWVKARGEARI